jgi:hypothetical protein
VNAAAALRARTTVDLHDLRIAGALMLAGALALPVLPGPDGVPCPLRTLTGIPCPFCGMTTSVIAAVHLHPTAAVGANPAGVVAVVVALALLVFRRRRQATVPAWTLPAALAAMWIWELVRVGVL